MTARLLLRIVLLALAFAVATVLIGWPGVPVLALVWGVVARDVRSAGALAGLAAALAWGGLLLAAAMQGPIGALAALLGDIMGAPGAALVGLTILLPALLAWTAARAASGIARAAFG